MIDGNSILKNFPLKEDEYISSCIYAVKELCKAMKNTGNYDLNRCLDAARSQFKEKYRFARRLRKSTPLTPEQVQEMDTLYQLLWPEIDRQAREISLQYATKHKAQQITQISAESRIREAMKAAGFQKCYIICQCYRAKVKAYFPESKYWTTFIVKYKDIQAGKLEDYIREFLRFNATLTALPFEVRVCK